jgi:hypothetical protein
MMIRLQMVCACLAALLLWACAPPAPGNPTQPAQPTKKPVGTVDEPAFPINTPPDTPVTSPAYPSPGEPLPAPFAPQPGDESKRRGEAFVESTDILILESFPPQFNLHLTGSLPTPCNELRMVAQPPDAQNQIQVEVYSLVEPGKVCAQVLQPFDVSLPLGSFATGSYAVLVNGEQVGKIEAP